MALKQCLIPRTYKQEQRRAAVAVSSPMRPPDAGNRILDARTRLATSRMHHRIHCHVMNALPYLRQVPGCNFRFPRLGLFLNTSRDFKLRDL
jgi:hypothetical protein